MNVRQTEKGREYQLPNGDWVPSVTTVLGYFKKQELELWRKRIGNEKADLIMNKAAARGTRLHDLCESFLKDNEITIKQLMPDDADLFLKIRPFLKRITKIKILEAPLYSYSLRIAGRCDVIGNFDDEESIIDFKTTIWEKEESWIHSYFEQETAYSLMYEEMNNKKINKIVTIMVGTGNSQLFVRNRNEFEESLKRKVKQYHEENSS